jgi:GT2 family glycosyltransferase
MSIISIYNDKEILNEYLLDSLEDEPDRFYELVLIDNRDNAFESAANALNAGVKEATGDYYMFAHQDVKILESGWVKKTIEYLNQLDDIGVAGITGLKDEYDSPTENAQNTILQGENKEFWELGNKINSPQEVQTIDELCIIIPSHVFATHRFDDEICQDWHLYGVEYSLRIQYKTDYSAYVIPLNVWHGSTGMLIDRKYYNTLCNVVGKYKNYTDYIYTTCGTWPTSDLYIRHLMKLSKISENSLPSFISRRILILLPLIYGLCIPLILQHNIAGLKYIIKELGIRVRQ